MNTYNLPFAYSVMGNLMQKTGKADSALILWNIAVSRGDIDDKIATYKLLKEFYEKRYLYKKAIQAGDSLKALEDSLQKHSYKIAEISSEYDARNRNKAAQKQFITIIQFLCGIFAVCIVSIIIRQLRRKKQYISEIISMSEELKRSQLKLSEMTKELETLANKQETYKKKIQDCELAIKQLDTDKGIYANKLIKKERLLKTLTHKLDLLNSKENTLKKEFESYKEEVANIRRTKVLQLRTGHKLFCELHDGTVKNISKISDEDIDAFITYYNEIKNKTNKNFTYNRRRWKQELLLILQDMGFDTNSIAEIMCISARAVRTMKSRIGNHKD